MGFSESKSNCYFLLYRKTNKPIEWINLIFDFKHHLNHWFMLVLYIFLFHFKHKTNTYVPTTLTKNQNITDRSRISCASSHPLNTTPTPNPHPPPSQTHVICFASAPSDVWPTHLGYLVPCQGRSGQGVPLTINHAARPTAYTPWCLAPPALYGLRWKATLHSMSLGVLNSHRRG